MTDEIIEKASILQYPQPTKEPGQRAVDLSDIYFTRFIPPWSRPPSWPANAWRNWVLNQPIATICKETLISNLLALDWKITPRDMKYRDELAPTVKYYTKLLEKGGLYPELGLDYSGLLEWIVGDFLDLPFGAAAEIGRKQDSPDGRVLWVKPLDAGTLFPTLNAEYPIVQYYMGYDVVAFPAHAISRTYMSPQPNLYREGWGMAPPEKIFFAIDLLSRGDKYYANLLLDIPTAGILDLGDMEKDSALEWVTAFRTFMSESPVAFKVPVLYEHNNEVKYIPFGKVPNDIMFDKITMKYAAIVAAGYGVTLGDIGLQTSNASGETLAGSIRSERKTKRTGHARTKSKWKYFIQSFLPETLQFSLIDLDGEQLIEMGRARLASATAFKSYVDLRAFSPQEVRAQTIQDGLFSIALPEDVPPEGEFPTDMGDSEERPGALGSPASVSSGGEGEIKSFTFKSRPKVLDGIIHDIVKQTTPKVIDFIHSISEDEILLAQSFANESLFTAADELGLQSVLDGIIDNKLIISLKFDGIQGELDELSEIHGVNLSPHTKELQDNIKKGVASYIGKAVIFILNEVIFTEDAVDTEMDVQYDYVVESVKSRVNSGLESLVSAHVTNCVNKLIEKTKLEN